MNIKVIAIVVGAIVLIGGGAYFLTKDDKDSNSSSQSSQTDQTNQEPKENEQTQASEETEVTGNLQTLRAGGKAQQCSMSYSDGAGSGSGTMYTDGKGRGRIQLTLTTSRGNAGESNTLVTGEKVYSWTKTDGGSFGYIFDASTVQPGSTGSPTTSSSQTAGKDFSLKCKSWNVDEAVLTVPTDVNFSVLPSTQ